MCVIIIKPPDGRVHRRELKEAFRVNNDGAGLMFNDGNEVHVIKGWFGFRKFYKLFRNFERLYPNSTFVLHMRIGTSGERSGANCHPFAVTPYVGFAHNGIMRLLGDKMRSDTREFVEDVLCHLPDLWWTRQDIVTALEKCATASSSKFVILFGDGQYIICNQDAGHWKAGCWYSNYSYIVTQCPHISRWDDKQKCWVSHNRLS